MPGIAFTSLRGGVVKELRARIVSGELAPGARINEVHLARELAVSRTPLREALTRLTGEQLVEARERHGFYVRALSADEVRELYAIRARLDPWALELAGLPTREATAELHALNHALASTSDPAIAIDIADRWHFLLLAGCPNRTLLEVIRQMMWRTRRYEHAFFADGKNIAGAVREHAAILRAVRRKDLAEVRARLVENMSTATDVLVAHMEAR